QSLPSSSQWHSPEPQRDPIGCKRQPQNHVIQKYDTLYDGWFNTKRPGEGARATAHAEGQTKQCRSVNIRNTVGAVCQRYPIIQHDSNDFTKRQSADRKVITAQS